MVISVVLVRTVAFMMIVVDDMDQSCLFEQSV